MICYLISDSDDTLNLLVKMLVSLKMLSDYGDSYERGGRRVKPIRIKTDFSKVESLIVLKFPRSVRILKFKM